ncbi:MAG: hypothetical protein QG662_349 [Pseudomonadota bacterium]|nr:hypothetical protein [Pseudomonadota bacterium]
MQSRRLLSWLFALTLLFGQAAAFAHAIGHSHKHDAGAPEPVCEVCVAQASFGGSVPVSAYTPPVQAASCQQPPARAEAAPPPRSIRAPARAPPTPA